MAAWIKMPLGTEIGLGPNDIVLDGDAATPPQKGDGAPCPILAQSLLWPNSWMDQDGTWHGGGPCPGHIVLDGDPGPRPQKRGHTPNFRPMSIVAKHLDASGFRIPLGTGLGLILGDILLDADPTPLP